MTQKSTRNRLFSLLLICSLLVSVIAVAIPAKADNAIQVSDLTAVSKFRKSMTFTVKASSSKGKIVSVRLLTKARFGAVNVDLPEKFEPAETVSLEVVQDTRTYVTPAFQFIAYSWQISDDAGNFYETPFAETEYSDDTHDWQMLSDDHVQVYWYGLSDAFGKSLFISSQKAFEHIAKATGFEPDGKLRVVIYPNQKDFLDSYPEYDRDEWVWGQTFGTITVQWMDAQHQGGTLYELVPHELAHAFLHYRLEGRSDLVPSWLNEGQALMNELRGTSLSGYRSRNQAAARRGNLWRIMDMNGPSNQGDDKQVIEDWYRQAGSLVGYLYQEKGLEILGAILDKVNDGAKFEDAFQEATGWTLTEFEVQWRKWAGLKALKEEDFQPTPTLEMPEFPPTRTPKKP
jgi:hypothetical protein